MVSVSPEFPRFTFQDILLHIKDLIDYSLGGDISELEVCVCMFQTLKPSSFHHLPKSVDPPKLWIPLHWNLLP